MSVERDSRDVGREELPLPRITPTPVRAPMLPAPGVRTWVLLLGEREQPETVYDRLLAEEDRRRKQMGEGDAFDLF